MPSEIYEVYACGLPRDFAPPTYVDSTQTTISIEWQTPTIDGGCPIYDYRVERSDVSGLLWTEVNPGETYPREDPYIKEFTCELFPVDVQIGDTFLFRVIGFNT